MSDTLTGLSLQEFRARQFEDYVLPNSGLQVKLLRNIGLLDLVAQGTIPQTLIQDFQKIRKVTGATREEHAISNMELLPKMLPALNALAKAVIAEPPVADEPSETHLGVEEIPFEDRLDLFQKLGKGAEALVNFRQQPDGSADAGPGGGEVSPEAEPDPGD